MNILNGQPRMRLALALATAGLLGLSACGGGSVASGLVASPSAPDSPASAPAPSASGSAVSALAPAASVAAPVALDVTVDGIRIKGRCFGDRPPGAPAVVLSHGIGGDYTGMQIIEDHLKDRTMVCGYSRAGVGGSDPPVKSPRPVADVVAEMHDVLTEAAIPPPYFLVGFSGGGALVMMYAEAHPDDVVGFVSINPVPSYDHWIELARGVWTPEELQANEIDWYEGGNQENIDMTGNASMLTDPLPPAMPYAVMFDEDCGGDTSFCDRILEPLSETTEALAEHGEGGRFEWVKGAGHDIDLKEPERVRATLDEIWDEATRP
jgi:hypothetical protein